MLMIPFSILMGILFLSLFIYFVKQGDLDDLETPALRMLEDDEVKINVQNNQITHTNKQ